MPVDVALPNGMVVSCHQKHEVPLVALEVESYLAQGLSLRPGDTVFDVGANIGLFSLAAYEHCGSNLRVYAFEPVQAIFDLLRANVERNVPEQQVKVFAHGLSSGCQAADFAYYPRAPVISTAYPDHEADLQEIKEAVLGSIMFMEEAPLALRCLRWLPRALRGPLVGFALSLALRPESVTCRMRTLSQIVADHDIQRIDLLKVDVEKAELDVLEGIDDADWPKIEQAVVEVHDLGGRMARIEALLRAQGLGEIVIEQPPTLSGSNIHTIFARRPGPAV